VPKVPEVTGALAVADWRRQVFALYSKVREISASDPRAAHTLWRDQRNELFATHAASPLLPADREGFEGLRVADYDPAWRFDVVIEPASEPRMLDVTTGTDGVVPFELLGCVDVPDVGSLAVWRIATYGGGLFIPVKDALAGRADGTYEGGRYAIDTIKGADLGAGSSADSIVLDFNFTYNPSCAYDPMWACPLAPPDNVATVEIPVGER